MVEIEMDGVTAQIKEGERTSSDELFVAVTDSERTNFTVIDFVG